MADQPITGLPTKTASGVATTDKMLGIDSAEGYQILVQDVAKYIIENYGGSTLAGAVQTPKAAIDLLNSKTDVDPNIQQNLDPNSITATSIYYINNHSNLPSTWCKVETVVYDSGTAWQTATSVVNNKMWIRTKSSSTWTDWMELAKQSDVDALNSKQILDSSFNHTLIPANSNFNSYTTTGVYYVSSDSDATTMTNIPRSSSGKLVVMARHSDSYLAQYYYPSTALYIRYVRYYGGSSWGVWIEEHIDYYNTENKAFDLGSISSASTKTFEEYGLSKYQYGAYFVVIRGDVAPDATFVGIVRHNSSGYQISEIYKGNGAAAPSIDANGVIKTGTSSGTTFQALVFPIIVWGNQL